MIDVSPGVSAELAAQRAASITDVEYRLELAVPDTLDRPVTGSLVLSFVTGTPDVPVVLDFDHEAGQVLSVTQGARNAPFQAAAGHLILEEVAADADGRVQVEIEFESSNAALNRQADFLYSLFVPNRAHTAFPCFDQPDIKARYSLRLRVPAGWRAVANGAELSAVSSGSTTEFAFSGTRPLSTYQAAFAAGRFQVEEATRLGRKLRMFHRESDAAKVARNREAIFDLHSTALAWLEDYTGVPYPYDKFDFVAVPAFQFGGMEHPGAILYRASSLLLDPSPTTNQLLGRASLIAHETAHMWFGNLVTMRWFDDVWMKEVFANFMAARIVEPSFPELNHSLRFLLAHHPAAYAVDRTSGTHPIRQQLPNLNQAASLYGAIIYQKAPVVMRQLEQLIGAEALQVGLRQYLHDYGYGNAGWRDLIAILDARSGEDLQEWSRVWVEKAGRPRITATMSTDASGLLTELEVRQEPEDTATAGAATLWIQSLGISLVYADSTVTFPMRLRDARLVDSSVAGRPVPLYALPGTDGFSYGHFSLDQGSLARLQTHVLELGDPAVRASAWLLLWDGLLDGAVVPRDFLNLLLAAIPRESDELILQHTLGLLETTWWRFIPHVQRRMLAYEVESMLWGQLERANSANRKRAYFEALVDVSLTAEGVEKLARIWGRVERIAALQMGDEQFMSLARALALRDYPGSDSIAREQLARLTDPDRKARFAFVLPALSSNSHVRDSVMTSFADAANRRRESWVLEAVSALNHPLRSEQSLGYVRPALELVEEIERTGDIFFPLRWLNAILDGQQPAAADTVRSFLAAHPELPLRLRNKVNQAADYLYRAARIVR